MTSLAKIDAELRAKSRARWLFFRIGGGIATAFGLYAWLYLWYERGLWLGIVQSALCGVVLAHELGLLRRGRPH